MSMTKLHSSIPGLWEKSIDGTWTKSIYIIKPNNDWAENLLKDNEELISNQNNLSFEEFSDSYYARYPDYYPYCNSDPESVESSIRKPRILLLVMTLVSQILHSNLIFIST